MGMEGRAYSRTLRDQRDVISKWTKSEEANGIELMGTLNFTTLTSSHQVGKLDSNWAALVLLHCLATTSLMQMYYSMIRLYCRFFSASAGSGS
ncbi:hypothetical protein BYT27DRAFT_6437207 [Phlegmacium glaucopus]|nr:hypothetical protein BYT27DRAFT_6437207 [Phlegmacium glaucopus]